MLKCSPKQNKEQASEADDYDEGDNCGRDTSLYGEWQTEPLQLPHAVDGIVPRVRFCLSSVHLKGLSSFFLIILIIR